MRNITTVAQLVQRTVSIDSKISYVQNSAWLAVSARMVSFFTRKVELVFEKISARLSTLFVSLLRTSVMEVISNVYFCGNN